MTGTDAQLEDEGSKVTTRLDDNPNVKEKVPLSDLMNQQSEKIDGLINKMKFPPEIYNCFREKSPLEITPLHAATNFLLSSWLKD